MQIAALLSDLKSLSVCSHSAAINLVNVHKHLDDNTKTNTNTGNKSTTDNSNRVERSGSADSDAGQSQAQLQSELDAANTNQDVDLKRANDLVALHYAVKVKHQESGMDKELLHARRVVGGVLTSLAQRG